MSRNSTLFILDIVDIVTSPMQHSINFTQIHHIESFWAPVSQGIVLIEYRPLRLDSQHI